MKGIILAGGAGTRLHPTTMVMTKQLLPVYDKPMIYYPLSTLMFAGIRDILVISTESDTPRIRDLLRDGSQLGLSIQYAVQSEPRGLADAFLVGKEFIGGDSVCLVLGDNIFYGNDFPTLVRRAREVEEGAVIFGCYVKDPERFGVVEFDDDLKILSLQEKPAEAASNYAVVGLYFFDNRVVEIAESLKPSARGELEITDVHKAYMERDALHLKLLGRGLAWLDTGTHESLMDAANFVRLIEERQGFKISCIEEIAWRMGFISRDQLISLGMELKKSSYGEYLLRIADVRRYT